MTMYQVDAFAERAFQGNPTSFRNFENLFVELVDEASVRSFVPDLLRIGTLHPLGLVITAPGRAHDFVSRYFVPGRAFPRIR
ncbi:hypothetical protein [Mesorhizobium sp.]|uniref:hypothetical protein n=1 Tax=Mesorhizobium sp. TaxID=1871066 RepID=UPI0025809FBA|nr:hypothetical protein [Mesorhizobium sp.]